MKSSDQILKKKYLLFLKKQEVKGEPFLNKVNQFKNFYLPISEYIYKSLRKIKQII